MQILDSVSAHIKNVEKIEKELFTVIDHELEAPTHIDLGVPTTVQIEEPTSKLVYTDDGRFFGAVGKVYESLQPKDFFNTILESAASADVDVDLGKMTYEEYYNGRVVSFKIPFEPIIFKNRVGKTEDIIPSLDFRTGFAGYSKTSLGLFSRRLVCDNGMRVTDTHGALKVRHTTKSNAKALLFGEDMIKIMSKTTSYTEFLKALDKVNVTDAQIREMVEKILKIQDKKKEEKISVQKKRTMESILQGIDFEMSRTGKSAYGFLQGITYYTNHLANNAGAEFIEERGGLKINDHAQRLVSQLV